MSDRFEIYKRQTPQRGRPAPARATIRGGMLYLNVAAQNMIGRPTAVELLYAPAEKVLALRPVAHHTDHNYKVGASGTVSIGALLNFYRIECPAGPWRITPELQDGLLLIPVARASGVPWP